MANALAAFAERVLGGVAVRCVAVVSDAAVCE